MKNYTEFRKPEEKELFEKQRDLAVFEEELFQRELDLATLKANLLVLKRRYTRIIGTLYAELDDLEAQIAEAKANLDPTNKETQFKAEEARRRAQESQETSTSAIIEKQQEKFRPSDELKKLYRQAAKAMHPDLTTNEESQAIRLQMMAKVNLAYEEGSEKKLHEILRRWETSPDSVEGVGVGAELIRVIRKISQVRDRLKAIKAEVSELTDSDLWKLREEVDKAEKEGRNLFLEMSNKINEQIVKARARLKNLNIKSRG